MKTLPTTVSAYAKSPEFTEETVPKSLLKSHRTKAGTWARIVVLEGKLRYRILEPEIEESELSLDRHGVVESDVPHQVQPIGCVPFHVEFYR